MEQQTTVCDLIYGRCQHKVDFQGSGEWDLHPMHYGEEDEVAAVH